MPNITDPSSERQTLAIRQALNLALQHHTTGDLSKAENIYQQILQTDPNHPDALHLLGVISHQGEKFNVALELIHKAIAIRPDYAEAHNNLGSTLEKLGRLDEAITCYRRALAINPKYAEAHVNLGNVNRKLGRLNEAVICCHKALAIKPALADVHSILAIMLNSSGHRSEALEHFKKSLEIERGDNPINPQHRSFQFITKAKISHDIEQFRYLASQEQERERFLTYAKIYETVEEEIEWPNDNTLEIPLSDDHQKRLGTTYNRPVHLLEAPEVIGSTLSNSLDVEKITADYFSHAAGMTYFDNLLSSNSLASLRHFLLGSTIWFDFKYQVCVWGQC